MTTMTGTPRSLITLVHGTFARGAEWTLPGSPLRQHLEKSLGGPDVVRFELFSWSGANSQAKRNEASGALNAQLKAQHAAHPDLKHFVIAHSHGGNIAINAMSDDEIERNVDGIACINTPFIAVTRRSPLQVMFAARSYRKMLGMIGNIAGIALSLLALALLQEHGAAVLFERIQTFLGVLTTRGFNAALTEAALAMVFAPGFLFMLAYLGVWARRLIRTGTLRSTRNSEFYELRQKRQDEFFEKVVNRHGITSTPVLALKSASDETYDLFTSLDGISNLPYLMLQPLVVVLIFLGFTTWYMWGYYPPDRPPAAVTTPAATQPSYIDHATRQGGAPAATGQPQALAPDHATSAAPPSTIPASAIPEFVPVAPPEAGPELPPEEGLLGNLWMVVRDLGFASFRGALSTGFYAVVALVVAFFLNIIMRVLPMGYAWPGFIDSLFIRVSPALKPLSAQRVQFQEIPVGMTFLSHSQGYQQPELLDALSGWIRRRAGSS